MPLFRGDMTTRGKMVSGADPGLERVLVENRGHRSHSAIVRCPKGRTLG